MAQLYQKINYYKNKQNAEKKKDSSKQQGKKQAKCGNKKFEVVEGTEIPQNKIFVNYQELRIQ